MTTVSERLHALELERDQIAQKLESSKRALESANIEKARLRYCESAMVAAQSELALIKRSLSWRLTRPLRAIRPSIHDLQATTRRLLRFVCVFLVRLMLKVPGARAAFRRILGRSPRFKQRLFDFIYSSRAHFSTDGLPSANGKSGLSHQSHMSRSASEALDILKQYRASARAQRQRDVS